MQESREPLSAEAIPANPALKTPRSGAALASLLENSLPDLSMPRPHRSHGSPLGRLRELVQTDMMRVHLVMQKFDNDGSGEIDKFEFRRMVRELVGSAKNEAGIDNVEIIDEIYYEIDVDHSGCINFREIHKALRPVAGRLRAACARALRVMDFAGR